VGNPCDCLCWDTACRRSLPLRRGVQAM